LVVGVEDTLAAANQARMDPVEHSWGHPSGRVSLPATGKQHGELLGAHIIGENATELIADMGLALD
jgi:pyruvate/2-oxoglutarate dehydrogenase complex dihydrolipoamide dehydrogenase (E3) component